MYRPPLKSPEVAKCEIISRYTFLLKSNEIMHSLLLPILYCVLAIWPDDGFGTRRVVPVRLTQQPINMHTNTHITIY